MTNIYNTFSVSPDQRYVVFTKIEGSAGIGPDSIKSVEILDLKTGTYTVIPDAEYKIIGWIEK